MHYSQFNHNICQYLDNECKRGVKFDKNNAYPCVNSHRSLCDIIILFFIGNLKVFLVQVLPNRPIIFIQKASIWFDEFQKVVENQPFHYKHMNRYMHVNLL